MKPSFSITYDGPIDMEFDRKLEDMFVKEGYMRWASGMDLTTGKRDLAFSQSSQAKAARASVKDGG